MARAHDEVVNIGSDLAVDFRPRATCAICLIQENGAWWGHIGDSRIYHLRKGHMVKRSRDHSHVEVLIQEGAIITPKMPLEPGDVLLACTDGLWSGISDDEMADVATSNENSLAENLKALSVKALTVNAPYSDNTTGTALMWIGD